MDLIPNPLPDAALQAWAEQRMAIIPYSRMAGMTPLALSRGRARLLLPARDAWCGDVVRNRIHTGCFCALADTTCGFAVGAAVGEVGLFSTLDLRMDYLRSADAGQDLICDAHCHRVSRSVAFVTGSVRQADGEESIALVNATFMRAAKPPSRAHARTQGGPGGPRQALIPPPTLHRISPEELHAAAKATGRALPEGRSPYVDFLGVVEHPQVDAGPIYRLPFHEDLIGNPLLPAIHGGVLGGFAETVMFLHLVATNPPMAQGIPKAIDFAIDYLRPARPVDTYAQGLTIRLGNRVSLVQANLWQEDPQRPVAATRGHWLMPSL